MDGATDAGARCAGGAGNGGGDMIETIKAALGSIKRGGPRWFKATRTGPLSESATVAKPRYIVKSRIYGKWIDRGDFDFDGAAFNCAIEVATGDEPARVVRVDTITVTTDIWRTTGARALVC